MLKTFRSSDAAARLRWPDPTHVAARLRALLQFMLLAAAAYALSRATFGAAMGLAPLAPFAMAFFAAGLSAGRSAAAMLAGCMLGALNGSVEAFNLSLPVGCAVILGGSLAWSAAAPGLDRLRAARKRGPKLRARSPNRDDGVTGAVCAALAGLSVLGPGLFWADGQLWPSAYATGAALAALASAPFLLAALRLFPAGRARPRSFLLPEERAGLLLLAGMLGAGLYAIFPPAAAGFSAAAVVLTHPAGATTGLALGGMVTLAAGDARYAAVLGMCGAAAQLCGGARRPARAAATAMSGLAAGLFLGWPPVELAGLCAAAPLAMLVPERAANRLARWTRRPAEACDPDRLAAILRGETAGRLRALAAAFGELAEGYLTPGSMPDEQALIARLRGALCADCAGYAACWAGDSNRAAHLLCDLIALAAARPEGDGDAPLFDEGVPPDIARRCRRSRAMPERIGDILDDFARARRAELKRGGENRLISAQFLQAKQLIEALASAQEQPVKLRGLQAQRAAGVLERAGIGISDAMMLGGGRAELILTLREGRWTPSLAGAASARLSGAFGRVYAPDAPGGRTLRFARRPGLCARAGAACVSREAGSPSGDSHAAVMLDDERLMVLICDGMGSGDAAARESACAVRLLGRFLAAGAPWPLAVETVNAMMLNTSAEDMFSTVDLMLLNLSTGMAEFVKLAACPALIARGGAVERIEGGRLPLGILERVQPAASRVRLMPGDVVLLASDGVMDAVEPDALDALLCAPGDDMNALSERILALAQDAGAHRDDMTAVCVGVGVREAG